MRRYWKRLRGLVKGQPVKATVYICAVMVFGVLGTFLLTSSHASTPTASVESENGTISSCAGQVSDTSASGGAAVKFGSCSSSGPPIGLDATGNTIPDTNYPIPSGAIFMATNGSDSNPGTQASPVKTLNQAIALVPSGGTIVVRAGTYRDWYHNSGNTSFSIATKAFTLQAYPHEQVWFDGSDVEPTGNWTSDGAGHWYMSWSTPQFCNAHYYDFPYNDQSQTGNLTGASGTTYSSNTGPCSHYDNYGNTEANYPAAGDPQMVFIDGQRMAEVDQLSLATGGKFYYDWTNKKIYISTDPSGHTVELAVRPVALVLGSAGNVIRGVGFKGYASNEYNNTTEAAVYVGGSGGDTLENDVFTQMAGYGLGVGGSSGTTINSSVFVYNGFDGATANGSSSSGGTDNLVVENSVFNHNNLEMYGLNCSLSCSAAGMKTGHMVGFTYKNNIYENNQANANGAWCDTSCSNGKFINNLVENNGGNGYHYEQDTGGIIASNVFVGNQTGVNVGASNTEVYNNTFINNSLINIRIYDDSRPLITSGISVGNNVVYGTAVNDDWFADISGGSSSNESDPSTWFTALDYNSYWRPTSFTLYRMINLAGSSTSYSSSSSFNVAHPAWAAHDQDYVGGSDPFFVDSAGGNYAIRSTSAAYNSGGPIPTDVANALGVSTAAGQTRGAFTWPGKN